MSNVFRSSSLSGLFVSLSLVLLPASFVSQANSAPTEVPLEGKGGHGETFGSVASTIVSDDFSAADWDASLWRLFDPRGDATLFASGTNLIVRVPGGRSHDLVADCNCAPRLLQPANDTDFEVEAKFDSKGTTRYQGQGIIVHQDDDTYLRFEIVYKDPPSNPAIFVGFVDGGVETTYISRGLPQAPSYLRVTRSGDMWTLRYSTDGVSFTVEEPFAQAMTVTEVGLDWVTNVVDPLLGEYATRRFVGNVDYFFNTASPISPEDGGNPSAPTNPFVDVWYGDVQNLGQLGVPQKWANVIGEVWDSEPIQSLSYALNGGPSNPLNMGPGSLNDRLTRDGDYNIEIDYNDLHVGLNDVVITAIDTLGEQTNKTVMLNFTSGTTWALPDTVNFESAPSIADEALVVDGLWSMVDGGVRTDSGAVGLDRALVVGNVNWKTEYEVLVPFTVHTVQPLLHAVGLALGWRGHVGSEQPRFGHPYQALVFIRDLTGTPDLQLLRVEDDYTDVVQASVHTSAQIGARYLMRVRSESIGGGMSRVSARVWADGESEPGTWQIDSEFGTMNGSILLLAHRTDVTFGNVVLTPLGSFAPDVRTVTVVADGGGDVLISPPSWVGYSTGDTIVVTGAPHAGWFFNGWLQGLSGSENPDTIVVMSDTTIVASFGSVVTGIGDTPLLTGFSLHPNWPNPFSDVTHLEYELPEASVVDIEMYDVAGRRVHAERVFGVGGLNRFAFSGRDRTGRKLPNGVYFYRVSAASGTAIRKMIILR